MITTSSNFKESRRWIILAIGIVILATSSQLPWDFFVTRIVRVGASIASAYIFLKCMHAAKLWNKEIQLSAMRWDAALAYEEDILTSNLPSNLPSSSVWGNSNINHNRYGCSNSHNTTSANSKRNNSNNGYNTASNNTTKFHSLPGIHSSNIYNGSSHRQLHQYGGGLRFSNSNNSYLPEFNHAYFDWNDFSVNAHIYPHIRIIGKTGSGKTTLATYLAKLLPGRLEVITVKDGEHKWGQTLVTGVPFNYDAIRDRLEFLLNDMYARYADIENGCQLDATPTLPNGKVNEFYSQRLHSHNVVLDEWRIISQKILEIKNPKTKEVIRPGATNIVKDLLTIARQSGIRLICLSQGEQVAEWGFQGSSSLLECFTTIRLGQFAIDHAMSLRSRMRSQEWEWLISELERMDSRACMIDRVPTIMPILN